MIWPFGLGLAHPPTERRLAARDALSEALQPRHRDLPLAPQTLQLGVHQGATERPVLRVQLAAGGRALAVRLANLVHDDDQVATAGQALALQQLERHEELAPQRLVVHVVTVAGPRRALRRNEVEQFDGVNDLRMGNRRVKTNMSEAMQMNERTEKDEIRWRCELCTTK